jgi:GMP synthase-like glutamine amidotransferase
MKRVIVCRYAPHEGPGYFATYLSRLRVPWQLVKIDEGEPAPSVQEIGGLGLMGGPMSVNDELPWIAPMLALIRDCVEADVPVVGHCLGGQLLAKALGASVTRNAVKEIGWGTVDVLDTPVSPLWGPAKPFLSYHWHGETFALPEGAVRVWSSPHCANQAFALGRHFGMQCHVEMTEELIESWCATGADEIERSVSRSRAVQRPSQMREDLASKLEALHRVADRVYDRWIEGLKS